MNYDFVVVGGGSAGYAGARTAFDLGMKTCVVEGGATVGGLCILRGCMPSKTVIESANRLRAIRHAREFGLRAGQIGFDAGEIVARKQRLVSEFADHRREQLQEGGFDFVRGTATFLDENTLQVKELTGSEKLLSARSFLISTGSIISVPEIPGLDEAGCLTSDDALNLTQIPDSILVLGGGPVALEFAHYLEALPRHDHPTQRPTAQRHRRRPRESSGRRLSQTGDADLHKNEDRSP